MGAPLEERHKVQVLGELGGAQQRLNAHHLLHTKSNIKKETTKTKIKQCKINNVVYLCGFGKNIKAVFRA